MAGKAPAIFNLLQLIKTVIRNDWRKFIHTLTESSEFLITLFSGFTQAESESISKNMIWGIQKSREGQRRTTTSFPLWP